MQQIVNFNTQEIVKIASENVGGVLLDIMALQGDGVTVCNVANLNNIALSVKIHRQGKRQASVFCDGWLDDILAGLTAGTTRYAIATTKRTNGYLIPIGFDGCVKLRKGDYIEIKVNARSTSFTSLSTANSNITVETVPATSQNPVCTAVDMVAYINGEQKINKDLGSNVVKVVLANDFTADYSASVKAKPVNGITLYADGFEKSSSENLLLAENLNQLQYNPDTPVKHLSVYNDSKIIHNAKLQANFDKVVDSSARILVLRRAVL